MPGTIVQPSGHGGADDDADCKCGDEIFAKENQKWCRHKFCTGEGEEVEDKGTWSGEMEGGKRTGAECTGRALNLKKTCNRKCNFYKEDEDRNFDGLLRGYVPCNASHVTITECVQEDKMRDGRYDCRNRADEEAFQTHIGNSSSLLLDIEKILIPCNDSNGVQGFKCLEANVKEDCLRMYDWCRPYPTHTCNELKGTTATGKTIDPQLCSNQSFWDQKTCNWDTSHRCTGGTPGQCGDGMYTKSCKDGSSDIKPAKDGDCGGDLMCTAWGGKWKNLTVCIKDQYKCDGVVHCEKEEDEANCNQTATKKCWHEKCDQAFKGPSGGHCEDKDDLMCRARDGKWAGENICLKKEFLCDNYIQCEDGKDEERCEDEYLRKGIFPRDYNFVCKSPFLEITTEENKTDRFFPMRAIRFTSKSQSLSSP